MIKGSIKGSKYFAKVEELIPRAEKILDARIAEIRASFPDKPIFALRSTIGGRFDLAEIILFRNQGWSLDQIAKHYGVTRQAVFAALKRVVPEVGSSEYLDYIRARGAISNILNCSAKTPALLRRSVPDLRIIRIVKAALDWLRPCYIEHQNSPDASIRNVVWRSHPNRHYSNPNQTISYWVRRLEKYLAQVGE